MILFHAKRDGTVTTTPDLVPQGSSMQDLVVVSEFDYAYCAIRLTPASGEYIEDIPCTPILQSDGRTLWTASLPTEATVVAGPCGYQLVFTAADGTTQTTLAGSFTVPRGVPVSTPASVGELAAKTVSDLYTILSNLYVLFVGHEGNIYKNTTDIAALKKTVASAGYVTIPVTQWEDGTPTIATFTLDGFGAGMTAMLIPADSNTQTAAREARLSAYPVAFPIDSDTQAVEIIRADAAKAPDIPLRFAYLILKTDAAVAPSVAIIGVDAYGEGGGTASGVDETAVRAIITAMLGNVVNERQYSASNPPPYPVTSVNGKTGAVSLVIPSKAADVKAEEAGAVSTHNADQTAHPYLSGRVATALDRISGHDTNIEEINTSVAERLKTADLAAKLDAYKAAQGLVSNTTSNLTNYYLKSEIYTKEEVAALISAIPKFEIKVVSSLPTANISLTTVYLVKDTTEGGGMYTEYIYVNGTWEELGNQNLDLSGYLTDEELNNLLKDYATLTKVSELIADALKPYATEEEITEAIRVATVNLVTGAQVTIAINNALNAYYTSAQVDAEIAAQIKTALSPYIKKEDADKAYQPMGDYQPAGNYQPAGDYPKTAEMNEAISNATKGLAPASSLPTKVSQLANDREYLTPTTGDQRYAKPSDIPTVPQTLPNPYALKILGKTYNGSSAVALTVEELIEAIKTASGGVVAFVGDDNNIYLSGNLTDGTYKAYYEIDGEYIEIGALTIGEESTDPVTYTVTFVADGATVSTVTYTVENPVVEEPAVPAKDGYTGVWETYDLTKGGNITVNAVYTAIEVEPAEPKNFVVYDKDNTTAGNTTIWTNQARFNSGGSVVADTSTTYGVAVVSNFIPVQNGDTVYYEGFYTPGKSSWLGDASNNPVKYGALSTIQTSGHIKDLSEAASGDRRSGQFTISHDDVKCLRLGGFVSDTDTPVIKIMRDGKWLTGEE